jgi:secreted PhoX family phosphatase
LPELGRGSWENVTAIATPDQDRDDGHIALLLGDDLEFGGAPLYMWIGRKIPGGSFPERNGLTRGQLHVWKATSGDRNPEDWHGTGTSNDGTFVPIDTRDPAKAGKDGYDRDGYVNDLELRKRAKKLGAFMLSRPEDLHTNPRNGTQVVLCSTGHGRKYPSDDWGTVYLIDVRFDPEASDLGPAAAITILHDCDDFGDQGIRSADNVVWASDGFVYIHEDKATKKGEFGGETGRESSTWRIDPQNPDDREVIAVIDRSVVLPENARDRKADQLGAWECCGLLDVSAQFGAGNELLMITAVQAHWIRGGDLGGADDLFQGGQLILLSKRQKTT